MILFHPCKSVDSVGYTAEGYALRGLGKKLELDALTVRVSAVSESDVLARTIALGDGIARLEDGSLLRAGIGLREPLGSALKLKVKELNVAAGREDWRERPTRKLKVAETCFLD